MEHDDDELVTRRLRIPHKILVVDDLRENLFAAEAALSGLGAMIVPAASGDEALRRLLESDYSLVLLDVQMPTLDGYQTAELIRSRSRSAHVPIIFLTAHDASPAEVLRAYGLGAVDFLQKPFAPEILRAKIQVLLALQERTEEIGRLRLQHEQLTENDHRKNEFLAILAHELRNPLAPLRALFDLAQQAPDEPLSSRMLEIGDRQLTLLARLVDDLLDIARITANKIELRPETLDLREAIEVAITTSTPRIADRHHTLVTRISETPIPVTIDSLRMVQVISNLLNNAARYTPSGGRIEVTCTSGASEAAIAVTDNGIGIPPELVPTIFDMFVQERARSDGSGGLGLGLALAKHLVALHGGALAAESPGRGLGSTFRIAIPLAGTDGALRPRKPTRDMEPLDPVTRTLRIVIVDDNEDARELVAHMLESAGHDVRIAHDGPSGLETILEHRPDAALIDIGLPGMTGLEIVRALRDRCPDLPTRLVAFTGYCGSESLARAAEAGFHDHLVKPVSLDAMLRCLSAG
jgi:signal transduction histidine kinase